MGASASAEIFYGFDLGDMYDARPQWWDDGDHGDWEEYAARKLGWVEAPYPDWSDEFTDRYVTASAAEKDRLLREREQTPVYKTWLKSRRAVRETLEHIGLFVELDCYGYMPGDELSFMLKVTESVREAWDCGSAELPDWLGAKDDWRSQLLQLADLLELGDLGEPGWHMVVSYG